MLFLEIQVHDLLCRLFQNALQKPLQVGERAACTNPPEPPHSLPPLSFPNHSMDSDQHSQPDLNIFRRLI